MIQNVDLKRYRHETTIANFERWLDYLRQQPERSREVLEMLGYFETAVELERRKLVQWLEIRGRG